jgi:membrane protease YdiL (CAAX protease family)
MTRRRGRLLDRLLPMPLSHVAVEHVDDEADVRRRRAAVALTSVSGATLLGLGLSTRPASRAFYALTFSVAGTWTAGGLASGPLHLGWIQMRDESVRRPVLTPLATGVGAFGVFYAAALVARRIPVLERAITNVLRFADEGDDRLVLLTTLTNGLAEEVFFRGALYSSLPPRHAVAGSTAVYTLATTTTRNPALVIAAAVMGWLLTLQRRATGGLQAPVLTHLAWSTLMVRCLPRLFRADAVGRPGLAGRG